jgi:hypothetical protein
MQADTRFQSAPQLFMCLIGGGIPVYDQEGCRVGSVIGQRSRGGGLRSGYAIVSLGGCLGIGEELRPVPWLNLDYDPDLQGYVTALDEDFIRSAPIYTHDSNWNESRWTARVRAYYAALTGAPTLLAS